MEIQWILLWPHIDVKGQRRAAVDDFKERVEPDVERQHMGALGSVVMDYLVRSPPIHVGMVTLITSPQPRLSLLCPSRTLGSSSRPARSARSPLTEAGCKAYGTSGSALLGMRVTWWTHKYRLDEDGERQEAKGSGSRTHYLRNHPNIQKWPYENGWSHAILRFVND